ncbi:hypothetical protein A3J23_02205 [Candidatus Peregrinibacteria bacterium RIFCSPLOWO2_02_FULL_48_14]|nr:MAG: hypothetical protein A2974_00945 [Candidatus Peregrinibacteria bacterium RIFCSPLOWO2_01_FULL_48_20]OGJ43511.1 MAG: hypothetical protein A3J23_02205 [Candidatus Peregrinibacteria bacterium RIFCSPLOWO2_02_FULL_48_14]
MWFFSILLLTAVASVAFCALTVKKLYAYINQYRFAESVYTLLFGFIRLRYFVYSYVFFVAVLGALGTLLAFSFLAV